MLDMFLSLFFFTRSLNMFNPSDPAFLPRPLFSHRYMFDIPGIDDFSAFKALGN